MRHAIVGYSKTPFRVCQLNHDFRLRLLKSFLQPHLAGCLIMIVESCSGFDRLKILVSVAALHLGGMLLALQEHQKSRM